MYIFFLFFDSLRVQSWAVGWKMFGFLLPSGSHGRQPFLHKPFNDGNWINDSLRISDVYYYLRSQTVTDYELIVLHTGFQMQMNFDIYWKGGRKLCSKEVWVVAPRKKGCWRTNTTNLPKEILKDKKKPLSLNHKSWREEEETKKIIWNWSNINFSSSFFSILNVNGTEAWPTVTERCA